MTLAPGVEAAFRYTVMETDTTAALGSRDVPVLATLRVLVMAEWATIVVVAGALAGGATTVTRVSSTTWPQPSRGRPGGRRRARVGRRPGLEFAVCLRHGCRPVANGRITQVVVDTDLFLRDAGAGADT